MLCGSCLRDHRLTATLKAQGHDITLLQLYTPLRTDEQNAQCEATTHIFYGGINVFLQQRFAVFRMIPRVFRTWLDSKLVLKKAAQWSGSVNPKSLAELTVSVLEGTHGAQASELARLIDYLHNLSPSVIHLPNLLFIGIAEEIKRAIGVPIVCTLSGEDIFLDQLVEPHRARCFDLIRKQAPHVDAFVAVSKYYAQHAAQHFNLPASRTHVVPLGIPVEEFDSAVPTGDSFTIGYLGRVCPEKGLANLVDALVDLRRAGRNCRVCAAGYLSADDRPYLESIRQKLQAEGVADRFTYLGEVTRKQKCDFLRSLNALSVPTHYAEAKGLYILEAMASAVPVIQPDHGSFPELIAATGGGILYDPHSQSDHNPLSAAISKLMDNSQLCRKLAQNGRTAVRRLFNDRVMADATWAVYETLCDGNIE